MLSYWRNHQTIANIVCPHFLRWSENGAWTIFTWPHAFIEQSDELQSSTRSSKSSPGIESGHGWLPSLGQALCFTSRPGWQHMRRDPHWGAAVASKRILQPWSLVLWSGVTDLALTSHTEEVFYQLYHFNTAPEARSQLFFILNHVAGNGVTPPQKRFLGRSFL